MGSSSLLILMAKSEIRTIHVWWTVETLVFQHTGGRENDFAISITFGDGYLKVLVSRAVRRLDHFSVISPINRMKSRGPINSTLAIFLETRLRSETLHTWHAPDMEYGY
jgi:hypothetical protein